MRRNPEITYFREETLDYVFKMQELFKKISEEKKDDTCHLLNFEP